MGRFRSPWSMPSPSPRHRPQRGQPPQNPMTLKASVSRGFQMCPEKLSADPSRCDNAGTWRIPWRLTSPGSCGAPVAPPELGTGGTQARRTHRTVRSRPPPAPRPRGPSPRAAPLRARGAAGGSRRWKHGPRAHAALPQRARFGRSRRYSPFHIEPRRDRRNAALNRRRSGGPMAASSDSGRWAYSSWVSPPSRSSGGGTIAASRSVV